MKLPEMTISQNVTRHLTLAQELSEPTEWKVILDLREAEEGWAHFFVENEDESVSYCDSVPSDSAYPKDESDMSPDYYFPALREELARMGFALGEEITVPGVDIAYRLTRTAGANA